MGPVSGESPPDPPSGQGNHGVRRLPVDCGVGSNIISCASASRDGAVHAVVRVSWTGVKSIVSELDSTASRLLALGLIICNPNWFARRHTAELVAQQYYTRCKTGAHSCKKQEMLARFTDWIKLTITAVSKIEIHPLLKVRGRNSQSATTEVTCIHIYSNLVRFYVLKTNGVFGRELHVGDGVQMPSLSPSEKGVKISPYTHRSVASFVPRSYEKPFQIGKRACTRNGSRPTALQILRWAN